MNLSTILLTILADSVALPQVMPTSMKTKSRGAVAVR
jgi:hypothetical protein